MATKRTTKKKATKKVAKKTTRSSAKKVKPNKTVSIGAREAVDGGVLHAGMTLKDRDEAIKAFAQSFNEDGYKRVVTADQAPNPYFLRRPTGIIELDIDLGGGFPAGGICFISGPDNSGKTWLTLKTMAMQQKLYGSATRLAYCLAEGAFPYDQAFRAGLRVYVPDHIIQQRQEWRRLRGMPPMTEEEINFFQDPYYKDHLRIVAGATGEDVLKAVLGGVMTNAFSVIAVDSLNGLQPSANAEKDMTDNEKMAAQATMIGRFFKKYTPITTGLNDTNLTTVLFTQQVRANQEKSSAPSYMQQWLPSYVSSGGGWSGKHYKLIGLNVDSGSKIKDKGKNVIGKKVKWNTEKGKAGTHDNIFGEVSFYYENGNSDDIGELIASGIQRGIIQRFGREIVVIRPEDNAIIEGFTAPNEAAFRRMLEIDFDFEVALRREILNQAGIQCLYV